MIRVENMKGRISITLCFEDGFCSGLFERYNADNQYFVAKELFHATITEAELYQKLLKPTYRPNYRSSNALVICHNRQLSFKRSQRESRKLAKQVANMRHTTKADAELHKALENNKAISKKERSIRRADAKQEQFVLKQQKLKEKRRGH